MRPKRQQKLQPEQKTVCPNCRKRIRNANFLIHQGRCQRSIPSQSSSRRPSRQLQFQQHFPSSSSKISYQAQEEEKIPCPNCSYPQSLTQLDTHPNECPNREVECENCHSFYPITLIEQHSFVCPSQRRHQFFVEQQLEQEEALQPQRIRIPNIFSELLIQPERRSFSFMRRNIEGEEPFERFERNNMMFTELDSLIELLAQVHNHGRSKGLSKEELEQINIVKYKKKQEEEDELCTICYCNFEENEKTMILPCHHLFHPQCIQKWLENNDLCPVCKQSTRNQNF